MSKKSKGQGYREHSFRFFCDICSRSAHVTVARLNGRVVRVSVKPGSQAEITLKSFFPSVGLKRESGVYCVGCGSQMRLVEGVDEAAAVLR